MAKKVLERGYQHRALSLEKALSGNGSGVGIPYRIGSDRGAAGERHLGVYRPGRGQRDDSSPGDSAEDVKSDSFFQADSSMLSSIHDYTVLSGGGSSPHEEETHTLGAWRRNQEEGGSRAPADGKLLPGFSGQRARGDTQGLKSAAGDRPQEAWKEEPDVPLVPRPPSHHAKIALEGAHARGAGAAAGAKPKAGEGQTDRHRAARDRGPRTHRLHPISLAGRDGTGTGGAGVRVSVTAAPNTVGDERGGAADGISQMLNEDVEYLQRLVRGSGVL